MRDDYRNPEARRWGRQFAFDFGNLAVRGEPIYTTCASAGTYLNILPYLRLFYPTKHYAGRSGWTVHFGWLAWEVLVHTQSHAAPVRPS